MWIHLVRQMSGTKVHTKGVITVFKFWIFSKNVDFKKIRQKNIGTCQILNISQGEGISKIYHEGEDIMDAIYPEGEDIMDF